LTVPVAYVKWNSVHLFYYLLRLGLVLCSLLNLLPAVGFTLGLTVGLFPDSTQTFYQR